MFSCFCGCCIVFWLYFKYFFALHRKKVDMNFIFFFNFRLKNKNYLNMNIIPYYQNLYSVNVNDLSKKDQDQTFTLPRCNRPIRSPCYSFCLYKQHVFTSVTYVYC